VRKGLAQLIAKNRYPEEPWRALLERYADVFRGSTVEVAIQDLKDPALLAYEMYQTPGSRASAHERSRRGEGVPLNLGDYEVERSLVFSMCLAKLASIDSIVKRFRAEYLGGQVLSPQKARELLTSPVAAMWSLFVFRQYGVPVVGHTYQVTEGMSDDQGPYSLVDAFAPLRDSCRPIRLTDRRQRKAGDWYLPDRPLDVRSNEKPKRELKTKQGDWKILPFPGEDDYTHRVLVRLGSVLGDLHDKVSRLIQRYPWEEPDAVWFVLTGNTPWVAPLTWQFRGVGSGIGEDSFRYGFITLKIESWMPPEVVQRVYSDIQRGLHGERRARRLEEKSLKLLRFVTERMDPLTLTDEERKMTPRQLRRRRGPRLVAAWDRENPKHPYEGNTWKFWRDYDRIRQAVVSPSFELRGKSYTPAKKPPKTKRLKIAGTDSHGWPIYTEKWYLLHEHDDPDGHNYTGAFDSRADAEADPSRNNSSEVLTGEQLVARLAERAKNS
jgi:hypothetical protein